MPPSKHSKDAHRIISRPEEPWTTFQRLGFHTNASRAQSFWLAELLAKPPRADMAAARLDIFAVRGGRAQETANIYEQPRLRPRTDALPGLTLPRSRPSRIAG